MVEQKEPLEVELSVTLSRLAKELSRGQKSVVGTANKMEKRFDQMSRRSEKSFGRVDAAINRTGGHLRSLSGVVAGAFSVRELQRYADAWTVANNKIAAASEVADRQGRSLSKINDIAAETRSGLTETADLYAKLLRATKDVAESEEDVARATELVNKAFKAGGAAASEQTAGILQLAQGLSSGILQGDELRSIRENAPLVAQAIADEFDTTIGKLKELGADGELTADRVFKAILNAQPKIEAAFAKTNSTIGEGFTALRNALTEYIGAGDQSVGVTEKITRALELLADNIDLVVAAGGVLAGRFIGPVLFGLLKTAATNVHNARRAMIGLGTGARVAAGGIGALRGALALLGGPFGLAITALTTLPLLVSSTDEKVSELANTADTAINNLDEFAAASARAKEEQDKLGGKVKATTAALLAQSRANLQDGLRKLREEYKELINDIKGIGLFDASEISAPLDKVRREIQLIERSGGQNQFLNSILEGLNALERGEANIASLSQEFEYLRGVGDEVFEVFDQFQAALADSDQMDFSSTASELIDLAKVIGGFEDELSAVYRAEGQPEFRKKLEELANKMFDAADAGKRLRDDSVESLAKMLRAAADTEMSVAALEEALKGNVEQAKTLLDAANPFASIESGAVKAKGAVDDLTQSLIDNATAAITASEREHLARKQYGNTRSHSDRVFNARSAKQASDRGILDLIGFAEGTDKGRGYNETLGYGRFTGGPVELTNKTLNEILVIQKKMLAHPDNSYNSSAVGRYQIVSKTLRSLIKEMGLSGNELFTPDLQDRFAHRLVDRRRGQGVSGLRNEWEGLRRVSPEYINKAVENSGASIQSTRAETSALVEQRDVRKELLAIAQQEVSSAELEAELAGKSAAEQARLRTEYMLLEEAKARGIDVNEKIAGSEQTYADKIRETAKAVGEYVAMQEKRRPVDEDAISKQNQMAQAQKTLKDGLLDTILEGEKFSDVLANVAKMLARAALEAALFGKTGIVTSLGGGGAGGGFWGSFLKLLSFDGGGYTGSGPRSGGIDGKGGFPAILHPNETVVDHSKGQSTGGATVVNVSMDLRGADAGSIPRIEASVAALEQKMPAIVIDTMVKAKKRNVKL